MEEDTVYIVGSFTDWMLVRMDKFEAQEQLA